MTKINSLTSKKKLVLFFILCLVIAITIFSVIIFSNDDKEDITKDVNKDGSIETTINVEHLTDSLDVIITRYQVWNNNYVTKEFYHRDTVSALGLHTTIAEDNEGNEKSVEVKKDYEIYITVK